MALDGAAETEPASKRGLAALSKPLAGGEGATSKRTVKGRDLDAAKVAGLGRRAPKPLAEVAKPTAAPPLAVRQPEDGASSELLIETQGDRQKRPRAPPPPRLAARSHSIRHELRRKSRRLQLFGLHVRLSGKRLGLQCLRAGNVQRYRVGEVPDLRAMHALPGWVYCA